MKIPFDRVEATKLDNLPDHVLETINKLVEKILVAACVDFSTGRIDSNYSLAAMQKALCLLIAKFFKEEQLDQIIDQVYTVMKENVHLWKGNNELD